MRRQLTKVDSTRINAVGLREELRSALCRADWIRLSGRACTPQNAPLRCAGVKDAMTTKYGFAAIGLAALLVNAGCAQSSPTAPASLGSAASVSEDGAALTSSSYVVTLMPDLTASPSSLSVASGYKVLFVNQSGRSVVVHSYNCSEFTYMSVYAGERKNSLPFNPAGKTCDYFAYNASYQKIFVGQVAVK